MLRGTLSDEEKSTISAKLPNLDDLLRASLYLDAEWDSMRLGHEPMIPIAGVCLRDAISMLSMSRFAVYEAYAHQLWYRQYATCDNTELWALRLGRFFADDASLRLYVVGECLADAIIIMLRTCSEINSHFYNRLKAVHDVV